MGSLVPRVAAGGWAKGGGRGSAAGPWEVWASPQLPRRMGVKSSLSPPPGQCWAAGTKHHSLEGNLEDTKQLLMAKGVAGTEGEKEVSGETAGST